MTILSWPTAAGAAGDLRVDRRHEWVGPGSAVLVAGPDAAAVGEAVAGLRASGVPAAGWVGDPSDPAVREMAAELFPGSEVVGPGDP
ncbi:MAG TPA: hypothetical protein VJS45_11670 [Acidimicrobiia bacterium]|nr:hypothetical protein [Acidimicrobiia bacterium]